MIADIKFYFSLFVRRIHYFLFVFVCVASIGSFFAFTLPEVYRAEARLLVESPQIPDDLAASTVRAASTEFLRVIEQRLLTRANLLHIAQEFDVYDDMDEMANDDIVRDMTDRIVISIPNNMDGTGLVLISFEAPTAETSADVTNELLTQILQQNVEMRTEVSGQTLQFFEQEVARLNAELAQQGSRILEFQLLHSNALPESLAFQRTRLTALQERVSQINREFSSLTDRRSRLTDLFEQTGRVDLSEASLSPEQRRLRELQGELAAALVIYSPDYPRVRTLKTQVDALRESIAAQTEPGAEGNELLTAYELQISDIDGQIAFLAEQKQLVEDEMAILTASINETPENAITLSTLERDYENIRTQFNQATVGLAQARTGDRIEALSKGQRIVVIEQASVPEVPSAPNRKLIFAGSLGAGAAAGLALFLLLEMLNGSIRRPAELTKRLGFEPLATLPYLTTPGQTVRRYLAITGALLAVSIGVPALLFFVHSQIVPMDVLLENLRNLVRG